MSNKNNLILTICLGMFGVHYFAEKRILKGLLYLFTFGIFLFGWTWDSLNAILKSLNYSELKIKKTLLSRIIITLFLPILIMGMLPSNADPNTQISNKVGLIFFGFLIFIGVLDIISYKNKNVEEVNKVNKTNLFKKDVILTNFLSKFNSKKEIIAKEDDNIINTENDFVIKEKKMSFWEKYEENKKNIEEKNKENKIIKYNKIYPGLLDNNFNIDKEIICDRYNSIFIDLSLKKVAIINGKRNGIKKYDFNDILEYELYEDGDSILKGRAGSTVMGGLLFGGLGAIAGASMSKKQNGLCTTLQLRITINDIQNPQVVFKYINFSTKKNGFLYKSIIDKVKKDIAILAILKSGKEETESVPEKTDNYSKLRELKKLFEDNIISEQEFNDKKVELLKYI